MLRLKEGNEVLLIHKSVTQMKLFSALLQPSKPIWFCANGRHKTYVCQQHSDQWIRSVGFKKHKGKKNNGQFWQLRHLFWAQELEFPEKDSTDSTVKWKPGEIQSYLVVQTVNCESITMNPENTCVLSGTWQQQFFRTLFKSEDISSSHFCRRMHWWSSRVASLNTLLVFMS